MLQLPNGFTLLEILMTLLIMSIAAGFVMLAVGDFGKSRQIANAATIFIARIQLAEQQAILQSTSLGLKINTKGYQFYQLQQAQYDHKEWVPVMNNRLLMRSTWPKGSAEQFHLSTAASVIEMPIVISADGELTPFHLTLGNTVIDATANGDIHHEIGSQ